MKLKLDDAGHVVVTDGKPVYIHDDGKEAAFDAAHTTATITRLNGEAKTHREAKEAMEGRLKIFEGIEDAGAALKALETVKNLDQGQLVTAGKVEEIKAAAKKAAEEQVAAAAKASNETITRLKSENGKLTSDLFGEKVGGAFSRSKFIADKVAVPPDMLQSAFGNRFKIENGKVIGVGLDGQPIYSRTKAGEIAEFDEAIESMVEGYTFRDSILKGANQGGGGSKGGNGNGGAKTIRRSEFDTLAPGDKAKRMSDGYSVVD